MNKYEVRIAEIQSGGEKFSQIVGVIRTALVGGIVLGSIYLILDGLQGLTSASEEQLGAMATLVDKLHISSMVHYCADGILVTGFLIQRRIAKRAISQKARYQQAAEISDPRRTSSGLTSTGDTPHA